MKRIIPIVLGLALVVPAAWCQQQWYDGKVYPLRSTHRFRIEPSGIALVEQNGLGWRGRLTCEDPWYPFDSIAVWPENGGYRCEWWHWQYLSFGKATGWVSVQMTDGGMEWRMVIESQHYGFPEQLFVRFAAR